jgi:flavin reductase (DIM6/NTAB) family NADH-FMN oxidoreductase RutF
MARLPPAVAGVTVSSFMSVSLRPPLVAAGLGNLSRFLARLEHGTDFGVTILADHQEAVARRFSSTRAPGVAGFAGLSWRDGRRTGVPLLDGAVAWLECHVVGLVPAGDHHLVIGEVDHVEVADGLPLVHHASGLRGLGVALEYDGAPQRAPQPHDAKGGTTWTRLP